MNFEILKTGENFPEIKSDITQRHTVLGWDTQTPWPKIFFVDMQGNWFNQWGYSERPPTYWCAVPNYKEVEKLF